MATATTPSSAAMSAELKAYEAKGNTKIQEVKAQVEQFEAKAKERRAQAEITAIGQLRTARENVERKVHDLKTTHENNMARAKADITAEVGRLEASLKE